jgi:hypothetical protein
MLPDTIQHLARELAATLPLPPGDWDAIVAEARQTKAVIAKLDELPLEGIEPAAVYAPAKMEFPGD